MANLEQLLGSHSSFSKVISDEKPFRRLDFSEANAALLTRDLSETAVFSRFVFEEMLQDSFYNGIGGYGENRVIYRQRKHFTQQTDQPRSIHLGTDIWVPAGEPVYAPLDGEVHSFAFNDHYGDYGPTIILAHLLGNIIFYTLYGHLSAGSLEGIFVGKHIQEGENFAYVGPYPENGDWPPHLHFQVIKDMEHRRGDFPGVSSIRDKAHYLALCPDPNLILRIPENAATGI